MFLMLLCGPSGGEELVDGHGSCRGGVLRGSVGERGGPVGRNPWKGQRQPWGSYSARPPHGKELDGGLQAGVHGMGPTRKDRVTGERRMWSPLVGYEESNWRACWLFTPLFMKFSILKSLRNFKFI
jgi:hypothetical protein